MGGEQGDTSFATGEEGVIDLFGRGGLSSILEGGRGAV